MTNEPVDLIIRNGTVAGPDGLQETDLVVAGGKIINVGRVAGKQRAKRTIDAQDLLVLPGVIDSHVHVREPLPDARGQREDWTTATTAAAAGGITTIIDMATPNIPPTVTREALLAKRSLAESKSVVDFALRATFYGNTLDELEDALQAGAAGVGEFMMRARPGKYPEDQTVGLELTYASDSDILRAAEICARNHSVLGVHAENADLIGELEARLKAADRRDIAAYLESCPAEIEAEAISKMIYIARMAGAHLHVFHVGSSEGLELIARARAAGQRVTCEMLPQHLLLTELDVNRLGPVARFQPPIGASPKELERRWEFVRDGTVDVIGSDHSPRLPEEKCLDPMSYSWSPGYDIWAARAGFCGVETLLPLMLTQVNDGRIDLMRLVQMMASKPAEIFGLRNKGEIKPGCDADFTVVDMNRGGNIQRDRLHSMTKVTAWDGHQVKGMPVSTIVRGRVVFENGELIAPIGSGRCIDSSLGGQSVE